MENEARCFAVGGGSDPAEVKRSLAARHPDLLVQTVRAGAVASESYAEMVCAQTLRAADSHILLAKKPEIDLLLRLASTTQITAAIAGVGAKKGAPFVVIAAGSAASVRKLRTPKGWRRLPRRDLTKRDLERIEAAALLNAARPRQRA